MPDSTNDLIKTLTAALESDVRIDLHQFPIQIKWEHETLVLEGNVRDIAAKRLIRTIAHRIADHAPIADHLRVAIQEPVGDGALRDGVLDRLLQEPVFTEYSLSVRQDGKVERFRQGRNDHDYSIEVRINQGVVALSGQVGSLSHRRLAEVLAWWTAGCTAVENFLHVVPPEKENEGELIDAVRIILEKDPLVHAGQIVVRAHHSTVTLEGLVASHEEKRLAVLDAWYVPGVHEVVDHIQVHD